MTNRITAFFVSIAIGVAASLAIGYAATLVSRSHVEASLERSIVKVLNPEGTGGGTGWVTRTLSGTRVIVTNNHVCQVSTTDYIRVDDDSGKPAIKRILKRSFVRDLCVIEGVDAPTLSLAAKGPNRFDTLRVMGHPLLKPTAPVTGVYTGDGIAPIGFAPNDIGKCPEGAELVDSLYGKFCILHMELSFTTVPIYPGNSGSPVVNQHGEVIGVMNSASSQDNAGMFIPLPYVKEILED